uniref:U6 snRNA phosphodiesterase n=1 Tax=Peronospora matthiolae TaxID=2874970 RepID=A0AAV1VLB8_9STRA
MESIVAIYGSSSESSDAGQVSSDSEAECDAGEESSAHEDTQTGSKRKRSSELQWKRAFPHVDGNWPSHVRIDIVVDHELRKLAMNAIERAQDIVGDTIALVPFDELQLSESSATDNENRALHLSLSRPFVLTYDQINAFVDSLRAALKWRQRFSITLRRSHVLLNDDRTRSFLALRVVEGESGIVNLLQRVDQCVARFGQPVYYQDPIPHISIASSMGEKLAQLTSDQCESLLTFPTEKRQATTLHSFTTSVAAVHVAAGNKHYDIPLR